ncbi:hypothetical protein PGT21_005070 [Puccinia graminis f. sp. tritici]|uniref:Uncharacterized protein n=1 Tax=Puccinia graminis f. sp. tritici TaxID=56615 RepID=A0A5B0R0E8_PUCGR|nr:hypothetical protein PGT21_005070 [Puccinia graminis f. sp. tritici]
MRAVTFAELKVPSRVGDLTRTTNAINTLASGQCQIGKSALVKVDWRLRFDTFMATPQAHSHSTGFGDSSSTGDRLTRANLRSTNQKLDFGLQMPAKFGDCSAW